ncbi:MAG: hypothetical protein U0640_13340 [Phycisphaerales bacterium]
MSHWNTSEWLDLTLKKISVSSQRCSSNEARSALQLLYRKFPAGGSCPIDWQSVPEYISVDWNVDTELQRLFVTFLRAASSSPLTPMNLLIDNGLPELQLATVPFQDVSTSVLALLDESTHLLTFPNDCSCLMQLSSIGSGYFGTPPRRTTNSHT